ncbi:MAG: hypothetical protein LBK61_13710, partial [Spirochaetaceae bacterium]|nr:hypothetical protein [Spirochaetaceae bacterium]
MSLIYHYLFKERNINYPGYGIATTPAKRNDRHHKKSGKNKFSHKILLENHNITITIFCQDFFDIFFLKILKKMLDPMSPNVPAIYDVFAGRISKCVAFAGPTKYGG